MYFLCMTKILNQIPIQQNAFVGLPSGMSQGNSGSEGHLNLEPRDTLLLSSESGSGDLQKTMEQDSKLRLMGRVANGNSASKKRASSPSPRFAYPHVRGKSANSGKPGTASYSEIRTQAENLKTQQARKKFIDKLDYKVPKVYLGEGLDPGHATDLGPDFVFSVMTGGLGGSAKSYRNLLKTGASGSVKPQLRMLHPRSLVSRQHRREMNRGFIKTLKKQMKNGLSEEKAVEYVEPKGMKVLHDGHHRTEAAKRLRLKKIPAIEVNVSDVKAKDYLRQVYDAMREGI